MEEFFEKWQHAKGVFAPSQTRHDAIAQIRPDTPARIAADAAIECINCGVCYAACDTVRWNSDYLGPAALTRAWTLVNDARDAGNRRAPASRRGRRRLPRLPLAPILPGALPADAQSDRRDCRAEAAHGGGLSEGRDQGMNVRLYVWQRATAALMAPLVLVHIAVIFYATRPGLSAADILSRTHGSVAMGGLLRILCRRCLHPRLDRHAQYPDRMVAADRATTPAIRDHIRALLALLGSRAVAAVVLS